MTTAGARRRKTLLWVMFLAAAGAVAWDGNTRRPTLEAQGTALQGPCTRAAPTDQRLRVGTYNIDGGLGLDGTRDLSRTAAYVRDCDLVALNEVHGTPLFGSCDQAQDLGQRTGLAWLFAPAERRWWHDDFGNGMLSSLHIVHWQRIPVDINSSHSFKNILLAEAQWGAKPLRIFITHVAHENHEAQLQSAVDEYLAQPAPCILLGDLNSTQSAPQLRRLLATPGVVDAITPNVHDPDHIDWIILRGLHVLAAGMQPRGVSDHPFYWVDVAEDR